MATVSMIAPAGQAGGTVMGPAGLSYSIGPDGVATVDGSMVDGLLKAGWRFFRTAVGYALFVSPAVADVVSYVAAVLPVSGTPFTIAAQPDLPRKLQIKCTQSGAVANLVVNVVGIDGRGNSVSESVSMAGASTTTFTTSNAYAKITSATPVGTVTNVTTIGIGPATALAIPMQGTFVDLVVYKEAATASLAAATFVDETVGTVDAVAGTIVTTTVPNGTKSMQVWWTAGVAD